MPLNLPFTAGRALDSKLYEWMRSVGQQALKGGDLAIDKTGLTRTVTTTSGTPITLGIDPKARINFQNATGVFNIRSFGAKQDGSTDDTAAIQATVDAAVAFGAGTVYTPQSKNPSIITSSINVASQFGVRIVGETHCYAGNGSYAVGTYNGSTWKWAGAANGKILKFTASATGSSGSNSVEHMNFDGGGVAGVIGIWSDSGNPAVAVQKNFLIDGVCGMRLNQCVHIGDFAGTGFDSQTDSCIIRRVYNTDPDNTTTSAAVWFDSRNTSDAWISDLTCLGTRYGIYVARVGYMKINTSAGGLPNNTHDFFYLNGYHGTIDIEQIQAESSNATINIASNPTDYAPINIRSCVLDSNLAGTNSSVQVAAKSIINSYGNEYNHPITFSAGASYFNSHGDSFTGVFGGTAGAIVVGATGTTVTLVDGATGGLRTTFANFSPPMSFIQAGSGATNLAIGQNTYVDVTGATVTFTPTCNCRASVVAVFDVSQTSAGGDMFNGTININGADQAATVNLLSGINGSRFMQTQNYTSDLTAGTAYTFKMRAKTLVGGVNTWTVNGGSSNMLITLLGKF